MVISKSICNIFWPSIILELQHSDEFIRIYYHRWVLSSYEHPIIISALPLLLWNKINIGTNQRTLPAQKTTR